MDSRIAFSVIVPVYNVALYLEECIQSVLNQTYNEFELILVDDGSQDNSPTICDWYKEIDSRIIVIHKNNGGVVSARQAGVEKATGDYLVFLDGDDFLEPACLSSYNDIIERYKPDIICCNTYYKYEDLKKIVKLEGFKKLYCRNDIVNELFPRLIQTKSATQGSGFPVSLWAKTFRKELYQQQQLVDIRLNIGEDGACVIPCVFQAQKIWFIDDCLYNYRQNVSSITKSHKVISYDFPRVVAKHIREKIDIKQFDFEEQLNRKIVHDIFTVVVSQFYREEKYKDIVKEIKEELSAKDFQDAILKAKFDKGFKTQLMQLCLKYRWLLLVKIYSSIK